MSRGPLPRQTAAEFLSGMPPLPRTGELAHVPGPTSPDERTQVFVGRAATGDPNAETVEGEISDRPPFPDTRESRFVQAEGPSVFGFNPAKTGGRRPVQK
jgi:hypothetical protein